VLQVPLDPSTLSVGDLFLKCNDLGYVTKK
jgi:hypothetical protein